MNDIERNKNADMTAKLARYEREIRMAGGGGGGDADNLNLNEEDQSDTIRNSKKAEAKQKRAIITQFDKIATNYQSQ